ncbi:ABC transporter permease [Pedobacter immunditicola]|uniref:ABC transporter permease n=1 Tax=Pedobacter immunditicola TaxID=3133440 RepID=UPI00309553A6
MSELFSYYHLLFRLVRKEFLINYQQTLLGPLWVLFQPILTTLTYVFIFNKVIGVEVGGKLPPVLFYFSGIVLWNFFSESFLATSKVFRDNFHLFSKVYFPRLIVPLALTITQFFRFLIQLALLIIILGYFILFKGFHITFTWYLLMLPLVVFTVGMISLSIGLFFSIITAKYRDLTNFVEISLRLLMFGTPIIYPLSLVKENIRWVVELNPLSSLFELFRLGLLGEGIVSPYQLLYSMVFMTVSFFIAILLFNKQGAKLIDVI